MLIRRAQGEDLEAICEVDARAFGTGPYAAARDSDGDSAWRSERRAEITAWYRDHFGETFVAIVDRRIVGLAGYRPVGGTTGVIHNNAVDPDYQGRGISTRLVRRVIEELKALGVARIEVATAHVPAALHLYQKVGFAIRDRRGALHILDQEV